MGKLQDFQRIGVNLEFLHDHFPFLCPSYVLLCVIIIDTENYQAKIFLKVFH